jgi:hypothetical protein
MMAWAKKGVIGWLRRYAHHGAQKGPLANTCGSSCPPWSQVFYFPSKLCEKTLGAFKLAKVSEKQNTRI